MMNQHILMEKNNINSRISYIDLAAGIMILWVLAFHAMMHANKLELIWLQQMGLDYLSQCRHVVMNTNGTLKALMPQQYFPYLHFFMPWFFYKSGQFFRKKQPLELLKKDANKLLKPFAIYSAIGLVVYLILKFLAGKASVATCIVAPIHSLWKAGCVPVNGALWFLLTLVIVRMAANVITLAANRGGIRSALIIAATYALSCAFYKWKLDFIPYWCVNSTTGLMFFVLGYWLAQYETKWWLWIPCVIVYIANCIWGFSAVGMRTNVLLCGNYWLNMPCVLAGIVTFNVLCRLIAEYMPRFSSAFMFVGQYSMIIYVTHGLIYKTAFELLKMYSPTSIMPYSFWIIIGAYLLFIPPICYIYYRLQKRRLRSNEPLNVASKR